MHLQIRPSLLSAVVLVVLAMLLPSCFSSGHIAGNATDQLALLEFKASIIRDPLGVLRSWNRTVHLCQWHGVTCGQRHQRVVALDLVSSQLVGSISPHLGNLSFLRVLNLEGNSFGSEIPHQVWDLRRLKQLQLSSNSISGVLPSNISCSSRIQVLDLRGNLLSGQIPDMLGCLSHLRSLKLPDNRLTGRISPSLGNLSLLQKFSLRSNNLTGVIPESLGQLKYLTVFTMEVNNLSGSIPPAVLLNLSHMTSFGAMMNRLEGILPQELGTNMPYLESFTVHGNQFTGRIPHSISNATNLMLLSFAENWFTGSLPPIHKLDKLRIFITAANLLGSGREGDLSFLCSLINATHLQTLALGSNNFGGAVPTCIGNLSRHLKDFGLEDNKLWGQIPSTIGNLVSLEWVQLNQNQFSGHIPTSIGSLQKLQRLVLIANNLTGSIPSSFGNSSNLNQLILSANNLHGSIPPSLGKCKNLILLDVSGNKLNGSIPPGLFNLAPFSVGLSVSNNFLTEDFPPEVGNLKQMGILDVSMNLLSGKIPSNIGACESLELLDMSGNLFQGIIPPSFASLRSLQVLNLSDNNLTGEIPSFLASFQLFETLNLSHNNFEGVVPSQGIFLNKSAVFLKGNSKLCGGIPELHLPKCNFHPTSRGRKKIILITSLTLGLTFLLVVILIWHLRRKGNKSTAAEAKAPHHFPDLSYQELFNATNGFSSANLIGVGGFGSVYKGVLDQGKKLVAIKVLNLLLQGAYKSFISECEALRNVRHRNLVKIVTVCSSIDQTGNDFKALVCELMSNGSIDEWLHGKSELACSNQSQRFLTLLQRLDIAIDVACALDYLHNQCTTPIVHCDLKPSNVLLDDNMTAHLGDFGLAKFLPTIASGSSHSETSSIGARGTIGYTPPEYGLGNEVSTYGDVYSYGVLLLEIFIGKRPTDQIFQEGLNLHQFSKCGLSENVWEIIDPTLLYETQEQGGLSTIADINKGSRMFHKIQECLIALIEIGVACSAELPMDRMNMTDVVVQLKLIKDKLLQTRARETRHLQHVGISTSVVN